MAIFGVVVNTSDEENFYNALRFSLVALEEGKEVEIFAIGKGVEALNSTNEKIVALMGEVLQKGGKITA